MKKSSLLLIIIIFTSFLAYSQEDESKFYLLGDRDYEKIYFKTSGNQIVLPIKINGSKPLNFILDSGVRTALIFELPYKDTISFNNSSQIILQGLGQGEGLKALISQNNSVQLGNRIFNNNLTLFVLLDDLFHISDKLGVEIHGIIGYDLLKDFIAEINYDYKYIKFYKPNNYDHSRKDKYTSFPIFFHKNKPYIDVAISQNGVDSLPVRMLIDTGGSDALWLFHSSHEDIFPPENYIDDFLGTGLSGDIFGKRSRISKLHIGEYQLPDITVSYPDSSSVAFVMLYKERNGSIGGETLSRFKLIIDYPNSQISFKKSKKFKREFKYNMSGIEVKMPYKGLHYFVVSSVRKGSPADLAGVKVGDVIKKINFESVYDLNYPEFMSKFLVRDGKRIRLLIDRNGERVYIAFKLKKMI